MSDASDFLTKWVRKNITPTTAHIHNDTLTAGRLAEECLWDSGREPKRGRSDRRGWRQPPKLYGLPAQFRVPFLTLIKFKVVAHELSSITDWLSAKPELSTDLKRVMSV